MKIEWIGRQGWKRWVSICCEMQEMDDKGERKIDVTIICQMGWEEYIYYTIKMI